MVPTVPPPGCLTPDFLALSYPYAPLAFARFNTQILRKLPLGFWLRPTKIHSLIRREFPRLCRGGSQTLRIPGVYLPLLLSF